MNIIQLRKKDTELVWTHYLLKHEWVFQDGDDRQPSKGDTIYELGTNEFGQLIFCDYDSNGTLYIFKGEYREI